MVEINKTITLSAGIFVLLAAIGTTYILVDGDKAYYCEDENSVGLCWKLSNVNELGISTRCYYNEETPTKYNYCKSGWEIFEQKIIGNETKFEVEIDIDFGNNKEILESIGIGKFEVRNETCINLDNISIECLETDNSLLGYDNPEINYYCKNYVCYYTIYQKEGINKPLNFETKSCLNWTEFNETEINQTIECQEWKILTDLEIEEQVVNLSMNKLNEIAEIMKSRMEEKPIYVIKKIILNIK